MHDTILTEYRIQQFSNLNYIPDLLTLQMNLETRKLFSRWVPELVGVVFCTIFFRSNMSKHSFPLKGYQLRNTDFCNLQRRKFYILNMPSLTLLKAVKLTERHEIAAW